MKFLSEEFFDEYSVRLKDVFSEGKTKTNVTLTLREDYLDVPHFGGKDAWYMLEFKNGVLVSFTHGVGLDNAPAADYIATSEYEITRKIMRGETSVVKCLTGGKIKLKGNLMKALKLMDTYNAVQNMKALDGATEW